MDNVPEEFTRKERRELRRQEVRHEQARQARGRNARRALTWLIVIVVLAGIGWLVVRAARNAGKNGASAVISTQVAANDNVKGPEDALVTLVEYGDYQCPACGAFHPIVEELFQEAGGRMRLVYRHFPLKNIHPNAETAARAVQAAGLQGKFWEMHALMYERQSEWSAMPKAGARGKFLDYAGELGLDAEKLDEDMDSDAVKDKVNADTDGGNAIGVNSTPTFYVNGVKAEGFNSLDEFRALVLAPLSQAAEGTEPEGTDDGDLESTPAPVL